MSKDKDLRAAGATLQEIGDAQGISKERVRQRLVAECGTTDVTKLGSLLAVKDLAHASNLSESAIRKWHRTGIITPVRSGARYFFAYSALRTVLSRRVCHICGGPLPPGKLSYCSESCAKEGYRQAHNRVAWRRFHRKFGQPITPSIALRRRANKDGRG